MTKTGKTLLLVLLILGLLSLGAELALGCFVYTRLRISNDTLTELRTQHDALRSELSGLRAELSTLQQQFYSVTLTCENGVVCMRVMVNNSKISEGGQDNGRLI